MKMCQAGTMKLIIYFCNFTNATKHYIFHNEIKTTVTLSHNHAALCLSQSSPCLNKGRQIKSNMKHVGDLFDCKFIFRQQFVLTDQTFTQHYNQEY